MSDTTSEYPGGGFAGGFGIGLLVVPLAVVFATLAGPLAGYAAFAALAIGSVTLRPFTVQRVAGIVAGSLTVVVGFFALLAALFSMSGGV